MAKYNYMDYKRRGLGAEGGGQVGSDCVLIIGWVPPIHKPNNIFWEVVVHLFSKNMMRRKKINLSMKKIGYCETFSFTNLVYWTQAKFEFRANIFFDNFDPRYTLNISLWNVKEFLVWPIRLEVSTSWFDLQLFFIIVRLPKSL